MERDEVVRELAIAGRHKIRRPGLLQNPQRPAFRMINRVEAHDGAIHADKRDRRAAADKRIALHADVLRLACASPGSRAAGRTAPGAAADIHGPSAGVLKTVAPDDDLAGAAFGLHAGAADRVGVTEQIAFE